MEALLTAFLGFGSTEWTIIALSVVVFLFVGWIVFSLVRVFYKK